MLSRLIDFLLAVVGLIVLLPVLIVLVVLVRRDSAGPGIFAQTRIGRFERPFTCYKLRTMSQGTKDAPSHEVGRAAVTRIGAWLRRTKLDELPQLWNIIKGEMSFVGPRPCLPTQIELIEARKNQGVDSLRPGITGIAQVAGVDMSEPLKLAKLDAQYIGQKSLPVDFLLILKTIGGAGKGDRVNSL